MKHEEAHHNRRKHIHSHDSHGKVKVDFERQRVFVDSDTYKWRGNWDYNYRKPVEWYLISKEWVFRDGKQVPFVKAKHRNEIDYEDGHDILWKEVRIRIKHRKLIALLEEIVDCEEDREIRRHQREQEKQSKQQARDSAPKENTPRSEELPIESAEVRSRSLADDQTEIKRDKHGIRLFSNDEKHFFNIGVYKSRREPEASTVCLFVAGRPYTYTLAKSKMEALLREITRTFSVGDLRRFIESQIQSR